MISVDSVEALFETIVSNKTDAGWLDSVSNFFSGSEGEEKKEEPVKPDETKEDKKEEKKEESDKSDKKEDSKKDNKTEAEEEKKEEKKEVVPEKPVLVKESLKIEIVHYGEFL